MELTIDPVMWERLTTVCAGQPDQPNQPTLVQVIDFTYALIEQAVQQAEDALIDLGEQG